MTASDTEPGGVEELLVHMGWVRQLARQLVVDANLAEDVAQETWLAALRRPPRKGSDARAWLATVLRNSALQLRRRDVTRAQRERLAFEGLREAPSDDLLHRDVEAQRKLAQCVMALAEPYC